MGLEIILIFAFGAESEQFIGQEINHRDRVKLTKHPDTFSGLGQDLSHLKSFTECA